MKGTIFVLALSISLSAISFHENAHAANESDYSPQYGICMDKSGGVTLEMIECGSKEIEYQDKLLNQYYKKAMSMLSPEGKKALLESQRGWIKMRDNDGNVIWEAYGGGSASRISSQGAFLETTVDRVVYLKDICEQLQ